MDKEKLIAAVIADKSYLAACKTITRGNDLYKDIFQELIIILMEYDEQKLMELYHAEAFRWFVIRIISNLWKGGQTSSFGQKYRHYQRDTEIGECDTCYETSSPPHNYEAKDMYEHVEKELEKMYWFEKEMFHIYLLHGSSKEVAAVTGISARTVRATVLKVREKLKRSFTWQ